MKNKELKNKIIGGICCLSIIFFTAIYNLSTHSAPRAKSRGVNYCTKNYITYNLNNQVFR